MAVKRKNRLLLILMACLIIVAVGFVIGFTKRTSKQETLSRLISQLESFKVRHGAYPSDLENMGIGVDEGVYYSVDSTGQAFNLAYAEGVMNANTVSYSSRTRKWEKRFNY